MTAPEDGDTGGPLSAERNRLLSLIDFSQHSARLRGKPVARVAAHGLFALHEHEVQGLPGIRLDVTAPENEDELWLAVDRLHETQPPQISSSLLLPWVQLAAGPLEPPRLRDVVVGASLIAAGTHCSAASLPQLDKRSIPPDQTVLLSEYDKCDTVKAQFSVYIDSNWAPWAAEEKRRRATIRLYSKLFTLKQKLEGGIVEDQLEFVWGVGVGVWKPQNATVSYPLLGRLVELSLNPVTAAIEIRPRDVDARLEVDWYASVDNPGLAALEKSAKEFFGKAATTFSPFDRGTFESLLRTAATNLDANGIYWPNEVVAQDRTLPPANDKLTVTDTWVLFARPRTNNIFLQDLETLKDRVEHAQFLPPAVRAVVTDPDARSQVLALPTFRGVSASYSFEPQTSTVKARDLYFPKAFNDEQVRIIQLLDKSDGVVVQGPPGTGKTHTIANVICHYLAEGKRVLVTSMKDPALAVLQEQLPEPIRPLAISLLTSEQDGLKQFEHAIQKIATEVQSLDRGSTAKAIDHLAASIDALHGRLSTIDREVGDWAKQNLNAITLENENIDPQDAARQVTEGVGNYEWIPDMLGISAAFAPAFSDTDVVQLRVARRALGPDIDYLYASLPQLADFPEGNVLLAVHQDLSQLEQLKREVAKGNVPVLADSTPDTIVRCHEVLAQLQALPRRRSDALQGHQSWTGAIRERLRRAGEDNVLPILEALGVELERAVQQRKVFLERPVTAPPGIECDTAIIDAVRNLAVGKRPFGLSGLFGKAALKQQLDSIRVLGSVPAAQDGWKHVDEYLACLRLLRELALRWNVLATELQLDVKQTEEPDGGIAAAEAYKCYLTVKEVVRAEAELCNSASLIFPNWATIRDLADTTQRLDELEHALQHYITRNRLASVWAQKQLVEKVLEGRTGRVIADIRQFFSGTLGNPQIDDAAMQAQWTALMAELSRVQGLGSHLRAVREGCNKIEDSGARELAELLRQPLDGTVDAILPDNWRSAWRLRRLATHLESIDCQEHLKRFSKDREGVASDLARAYRDIVVKRTWLRLAENASPSIRAALQAYLNAIQKIGKGTGKRAVRYRQDARMAASQANPAVPCWIMPHYRVSEALPPELGCFDLVVIDEASQSDFTALPSLLRAKQVLIVGDDKQVSPEGVGLEEEKVRSLMSRFLGEQVDTFRPQMSPERSIYDLFKVVFATSTVMLKEHFRCVGPIIEYSKREFYNHELRPLRMPKASERLDPPLIDVIVQDGYRRNDVNRPEAQFIVDEVKAIVADPRMGNRSIGVVSLLADKQALFVWDRLANELGPEVMRRHRIACGDARTFQGKERDIMFLSMVAAPNEVGVAPSRDTFAQRFNVAASRARDRMYLVRSVDHGHLSEADLLRRAIIAHFATPFAQDEQRVENLRTLCESPFEREMYDELAQRGYWITPQVRVGQFRIDMVVEGHNDARLAVECDGDKYHGVDKWADDMQRQRVLERAGWVFWRCFASAFIRRKTDMLKDLVKTLEERGIDPIGAEGAPRSVHTERRVVTALGRVPDVQVGTEVDSLAGLAIL